MNIWRSKHYNNEEVIIRFVESRFSDENIMLYTGDGPNLLNGEKDFWLWME